MKKAFTIMAVAAVAVFVACGPSAEEKAKMEERARQIQDSIAASISEAMQNETGNDTAANTATTAPAATQETAGAQEHAH
jgi:hypothetical protein